MFLNILLWTFNSQWNLLDNINKNLIIMLDKENIKFVGAFIAMLAVMYDVVLKQSGPNFFFRDMEA